MFFAKATYSTASFACAESYVCQISIAEISENVNKSKNSIFTPTILRPVVVSNLLPYILQI